MGLEFVRRLPPTGARVIALTTPVVSFGEPEGARVATIGINPSASEFLDDELLLGGPARRLATLPSLGAERLDALTVAQSEQVLRDCASYFRRNPYRRWFDPLDELLRVCSGASYYDGSACHLDLVQWATKPAWRELASSEREDLLADGVPYLRRQLQRNEFATVLVNGRQVLEQVQAVELVQLKASRVLRLDGVVCTLYQGAAAGATWVGWSTNLQSSYGITRGFRSELAIVVRGILEADLRSHVPITAGAVDRVDSDGYLPVGHRVRGKRELHELLSGWLSCSRARTIGDVGNYGGRPGLLIAIGEQEVALNADTTRAAVQAYVLSNARQPTQPWRVVRNRRGRINKVLLGPDPTPTPGWFAYLREPLADEGYI